MKKTFSVKSLLVSMAIASSAALSVAPATTQAGVTGNMGAVSTYVFRGVYQTGAAGQGGIDYESDSGVYVGTWLSNVDTGGAKSQHGLEYDLYGGWAGTAGGVDLGVGYAGYFYTNGFDQMYNELNLSAGFGGVTIAFNPGVYDKPDAKGHSTTNYYNANVSGDIGPISATLGYNDWDTSTGSTKSGAVNTYVELSYSKELTKGLDGSITYMGSQAEDAAGKSDIQNYLVFGVTSTFDIM
ncbi:TorF family putative porin [Hydrogenovibrio sp. 3SP14C1]|uniref:TorF family putative porin n=1 Tax=Hydrogenovibrio sp. 3SP14C1 TaxID=3038774 RepID=UPI0024167CE5|nr:TorF family putative porin [Hydrogenovibrio sp. 3SP14C1]MDG4811701.1 TorF family putative porin [Hydrogenovibrio sp. 3SP14C1]